MNFISFDSGKQGRNVVLGNRPFHYQLKSIGTRAFHAGNHVYRFAHTIRQINRTNRRLEKKSGELDYRNKEFN